MNLAAEQQFPTKWPFPPVPPTRRALERLLSPFRHGRRNGLAAGHPLFPSSPSSAFYPVEEAAPSPARPQISSPVSTRSAVSAAVSAVSGDVTLGQMIVDILLVAMWGAMIPAFMWLGAAVGF
jgi:hypothetical protein